ncbi:uncharacterized protein [Henckelia pumila]|uniref:uncharacterized protein isoform X5 n=1 Tax=Henckelia pumila TaxID=405737 RepID=UPI003C6E352F
MSKILAETTSSEGKGHSKDISGSKRWRSEIPYKEKNYPKKRKQSSAKKAFGETSKREDAFSENEMGDIVITMTSQSKEKAHSQEAAITHASKLSYKEEASKVNHSTKSNGQDLVGCKIKVWWRLDKTYYEGKVMSFDNLKKTHQVDYDDGETEILDLAKEHWEVITDYSLCSHDTRIVKAPPVTPSVVGFENKLWG